LSFFKKYSWVVMILLIGCAATPELPEKIMQADLNQNLGFMIGSFSRNKSAEQFNGYSFYFRDLDNKKSKRIYMAPEAVYKIKFKDDFSNNKVGGALFGFVLPEGNYEFYNFNLFNQGGIYQSDTSAKHDFSIPFTINSNKINYVGEIKFSATPSIFSMSNQKDRDLPLFKKKFPDLDWNKLVICVPDRGKVVPELVKFE
jgi:hypothetical protein